MNQLQDTTSALKEITENKHASIFLYGSRAKGDSIEESDYEIGIVFPDKQYISRTILQDALNERLQNKKFSVFSFKTEDFKNKNPDIPFNKNLFLYELYHFAQTLDGQDIKDLIPNDNVYISDLLAEAEFELGIIFSAHLFYKDFSEIEVVKKSFYKAGLFATRTLVLLEKNVFPGTYKQIVDLSQDLDLDIYHELPVKAYELRYGAGFDPMFIYKFMSFVNKFIIPRIKEKTGSSNDSKLNLNN